MAGSIGLQVGMRVVRGPDWKWGNQDDGEGHVGTVMEVGRPGSKTSPDKTVVVQWDSGNKTNYRVGYQGSYDLRLYDNAPTGMRHPEIVCDSCSQQGICGIRWRCIKCPDYDLCSPCYNSGKHDLTHPFLRFTTPTSKGVKCAKRQGAVTVEAKGIFPGAKVERGPSWDWGNQDGGDGRPGKVMDIRGWDTETQRSVANIVWQSGTANVYRLGHKGKVDLKYKTAAVGGTYYPDQLPVLGEPSEQLNSTHLPPNPFRVGDKVKVDMEPEVLKVMQEGHGGWNPRMADYVGKIGAVHRITDRGDVRVQYESCSNRWTFHPGALTKMQVFSVGDAVMIIHDIDKVKELQRGHGEWADTMASALGRVGKVVKVYSDGDMRVKVFDQTWTFNSLCCVPRPQDQQHIDNTTSSDDTPGYSKSGTTTVASNTESGVEQVTTMLEQIMLASDSESADPANPESLVKEAAQGHTDVVEEIITRHPEQVNDKSAGKTALQVASHQGNKDIVLLLLNAKADVEIPDNDGDTALHYSAFGDQPEIMELLLENEASINTVNSSGCTALHVAVNKQHLNCVKVLLSNNCNVNIQDTYGDTAQHDAIGKDNRDIVTLLTERLDIDFTLRNRRGFNTLHHAALKGNAYATEKILQRCKDMVDDKKDDGFSALHLAALNGHSQVAQVLLDMGGAALEIRNKRQQTPLMLAVSQGHIAVVKLLVEADADVSAIDEDGDSCLHLCLLQQHAAVDANSIGDGDQSTASKSSGGVSLDVASEIAQYLAEHGADVMCKNNKGKTPLDADVDAKLKESLEKFKKVVLPVLCRVCHDDEAVVTFHPCLHVISCVDCCVKMKKCLECLELIESKIQPDGSNVAGTSNNQLDRQSNTDMARKLQEMEESLTCNICLDRQRNVAFLCGHSACQDCSVGLRQCHMCRKPITKRINLFT